MSGSFSNISSIGAKSEDISAICDEFLELSISEEKSDRMVKVVVENFSDKALRKLFCDLSHKEYWDKECSLCHMPELLHKGLCSSAERAHLVVVVKQQFA